MCRGGGRRRRHPPGRLIAVAVPVLVVAGRVIAAASTVASAAAPRTHRPAPTTGCRRIHRTTERAAFAGAGAAAAATFPIARVAVVAPSLHYAHVPPSGSPPSSAVVLMAHESPGAAEAAAIDDEWEELANALLDLDDGRTTGAGGAARAAETTDTAAASHGEGGHLGSNVSGASFHAENRTTDADGIRARLGEGRGRTDDVRGENGGERRKEAPASRGRGGTRDDGDEEARHWDLVRFNMELNALARGGTVDSAEAAERMLFERIRDHRARHISPSCTGGGEGGVGVDVISFNTVLNGWARCGGDGGAERAEALLGRMEYLSSSSSPSPSAAPPLRLPFGPNEVSYGTVVDAWSRCGRVDGAKEAERVLRRIEEGPEGSASGSGAGAAPTPRPNARMYASVARGYARRGQAEGAEALLRGMMLDEAGVRPSTDMYASVIDAFANSGGGTRAAERAEGLLREMEGGDADDGGGGGGHQRPDVVCYTNAIKAWARSGDPECGERAEWILRRMWPTRRRRLNFTDANADTDVGVLPNAVTVTAAMNAWTNAGDPIAAPRKIEGLLRRMEELHARRVDGATRPDHVVYSTVLTAWARSREPGASRRAEAVLRRMVDDDADLAAPGDADVTDNLKHCFWVVIGSHLCSKEDGSLGRAVNVLRWMVNMGIELDERLFQTIFRGLAEAMELGHGDDEAVDEVVGEVLDVCLKVGLLDDRTSTSFKKIAMREFFER